MLLCVYINSHLVGNYKRNLCLEIDDHGFGRCDVVAYQQIGAEALNKVDLILEQDINQTSNIIFARKIQKQRRKL